MWQQRIEAMEKRIEEKEQARMEQWYEVFHRHPELSGQEFHTSKTICELLESWNIEVRRVKGGKGATGIIGILDSGRPGKTLALRADMDALAMDESPKNLCREKKVVSEVPHVCHACGHDAHMAMLLGAAHILSESTDKFCGKILFLFEEGEEEGCGIHAMCEELSSFRIDAFCGMHVSSFLPSGTINIQQGPRMAGHLVVDFEVWGRGGHGSRPDLAINPVFASAHILTALPSAWVNQLNPTKTVTLGIASIQAGSERNIIPEKARIRGTLRFFEEEEGEKALQVLKRVAQGTAQAHNCNIRFREEMEKNRYAPVANHPNLSKMWRESVERAYGREVLVDCEPWFASESFSEYGTIAPSCFAFLGISNPEQGSGADHHNEHFEIDTDVLSLGCGAFLAFVLGQNLKEK